MKRLIVGLVGLAVGLIQAAAYSSWFTPLSDLPGGEFFSEVQGLSSDGSTAVGSSISEYGEEAFLWTIDGGMVGLGDLPGGIFGGHAFDASFDGSVVVGTSNSSSGGEAFRWTQATGMVGLGDFSGGHFNSRMRWRVGMSTVISITLEEKRPQFREILKVVA